MNIKRAFITVTAALLMPVVAMAGQIVAPGEDEAVFVVNKRFVDGNDETSVTVRMSCNSGIPLQQDITVDNGDAQWEVAFVLSSIPADTDVNCVITEDGNSGYTAGYRCNGEGSLEDCRGPRNGYGSCEFDTVTGGQSNSCRITNEPDPVDFVVVKDWEVSNEGASQDDYDDYAEVQLWCTSEIIGGVEDDGTWYRYVSGFGDQVYTFHVIPDFPSSSCWAYEYTGDSAVESVNGCSSPLSISANSGNSCTITNTLFFEGIPTLSQYGLAILALLMLGVGFVGFRRFV